ncbi:MAG: polysaccharide biosynthesis/export family protein [Sandaracinobacteroides sp.]
MSPFKADLKNAVATQAALAGTLPARITPVQARASIWLGLALLLIAFVIPGPSGAQAQAQAQAQSQTPKPTAASAQAASARLAPPLVTYVLGPSDGVSIVVYGQTEFNVATRVKPDGTIVMPLIGKVQAGGKTVLTLADEITRRLVQGNFLKDPIVNIEITEYNSTYVRVIGKVGSPGIVPLDRSTRLMDVLLRAGWVAEAGSETITVRRAADGSEITVNTEDLALGRTADLNLMSGDTIFVPEVEVVYLTGAAIRPGAYPLKRDMTVSELLAISGGVGPTGSSGKFGVKRGDAKEVDIRGPDKLEAGDVIRVRERLF